MIKKDIWDHLYEDEEEKKLIRRRSFLMQKIESHIKNSALSFTPLPEKAKTTDDKLTLIMNGKISQLTNIELETINENLNPQVGE